MAALKLMMVKPKLYLFQETLRLRGDASWYELINVSGKLSCRSVVYDLAVKEIFAPDGDEEKQLKQAGRSTDGLTTASAIFCDRGDWIEIYGRIPETSQSMAFISSVVSGGLAMEATLRGVDFLAAKSPSWEIEFTSQYESPELRAFDLDTMKLELKRTDWIKF